MKAVLFLILLAAAVAAYYYYAHGPGAKAPDAALYAPPAASVAAGQGAAVQSGSQMFIERATGKTAVDQGQRVRQVIRRSNTSNARMPDF